MADSTLPIIRFVMGIPFLAASKTTTRHYNILKAALPYLDITKDHILIIRKTVGQGIDVRGKALKTCARAEAESVNEKTDVRSMTGDTVRYNRITTALIPKNHPAYPMSTV